METKTIELPVALTDELDIYLAAFKNLYGEDYSLAKMISSLLSGMESIHPEIMEEVQRMADENPAVYDMMGNFHE